MVRPALAVAPGRRTRAVRNGTTSGAAQAETLSRLVRPLAFCAVTVGLGVGGHRLAHAGTVASPALALALALVGMTWFALSRRELRTVRLILVVWLGQLEVHLALLSSAPGHLSAGPHGLPGGGATAGATTSWQMVAAHALAGAAAALWLRRGEASTWRLVRRLAHLLPLSAPLPFLPDDTAPAQPVAAAPAGLLTLRGTRCLTRRGPPESVCV